MWDSGVKSTREFSKLGGIRQDSTVRTYMESRRSVLLLVYI